ncbi:MAG: hypothetical protein ACE5GO_06555 [Anaerolineales bacterium]
MLSNPYSTKTGEPIWGPSKLDAGFGDAGRGVSPAPGAAGGVVVFPFFCVPSLIRALLVGWGILPRLNRPGDAYPVPVPALGRLFSVLKENVRCVVPNACYSEQQAQAIAEHIDYVVGMSSAFGDHAAVNFATAFYQALAYGKSVEAAFDLGCIQVEMFYGEHNAPKLFVRGSIC